MAFYSSTESSSTESLGSPSSSEDFELAAIKKFEFGQMTPAQQQEHLLGEKQKALDCGVCEGRKKKGKRYAAEATDGMPLDARRRRRSRSRGRKNPKGTCSLPELEELDSGEVAKKETKGSIYLPEVTKISATTTEKPTLDAWWKKHHKKSATMSSFDSIVLPETREISSGELVKSSLGALPETTQLDARHRRRSSRSRSRSHSPKRGHRRHHYSSESSELSESSAELGHWRDDPDYWYWRRYRRPHLLDPVTPRILDPLIPPIVNPPLYGAVEKSKSLDADQEHMPSAAELGNWRDEEADYWYWRRHRRPRLLDPVVPPILDPLLPPIVDPVLYDAEKKTTTTTPTTTNLEAWRGRGHRGWGGRGPRGPYRRGPYYWDPYYPPPVVVDPLWPLLSDKGGADAPTELDARHRSRDKCGRFTRRHHHRIGEESSQEAILEEMKQFVETNYPAKPIESPKNEVRASMDRHFEETLQRLKSDSLPTGEAARQNALVSDLREARDRFHSLLDQMERKYTNKPLDSYEVAPLSRHHHNYPHHRKHPKKRLSAENMEVKDSVVSRLATTLRYSSQVPEPGLRAMLLSGKAGTNLAACRIGKEDSTAERHLAHSHTAFYKLLKENGLVPLLSSEADLVLIVPYPATLDTITNRVSEETRHLLMYHLVVVPVGEAFQLVQTMQEYDTLAGDKVQVERRQECLYINGHHLKSDIMYPTEMYHIMGFLSPSQVVEAAPEEVPAPTQEPPTVEEESTTTTTTTTPESGSSSESTSESTGESTGEEELQPSPSPESLPPPSNATQHHLTILPTKAATLSGVNRSTTFQNSIVSTMATKMNNSYYSAQLDMTSHVDPTFTPLESAAISVRTYNPAALYAEYSAGHMRDISRINSEGAPQRMLFTASQQKRLDIGNRMSVTEYSLNSAKPTGTMAVKKADLLSGLTEISVPSLTSPGKVCVILCSIKASASDINTFMTQDESILLRFKNNLLDTISVNHAQKMPLPTEAHDGAHFLELFTSEKQRDTLYKQKMTREQFTAMLLSASSVGKYVKRKAAQLAKKWRKVAGKYGRKVLSRADREKKRAGSMRTRTVALTNIPVAKLAAQETGAPKATENLTIRVYGKDFTVEDAVSIAGVQGKKYSYVVGQDAFTGYLLEEDNDLGLNVGSTRVGQYVEVATPLRTFTFNLASTVPSTATQAYYGEKDNMVYLLQFAGNKLERILLLPKSSRFARKLGL
jgi:uncharacterized surface protein with fasciclin (FAS1) repeats